MLLVAVALALTISLQLKSCESAYRTDSASVTEGERLFMAHCASCHALHHDGIGPPLGGVTRAVAPADLKSFIRSPATSINEGNGRAIALRNRYKQLMPSYQWMDESSLEAILSFLHRKTEEHNIEPFDAIKAGATEKLSGRLVQPVVKSDIRLRLKELIQLPRLPYSTPDLGIATLRPHSSGDGRLFLSDQGGIIYEISGGKARIFMDMRAHISEFNIGPGLATGLGSFDFHPDYLNNGLIYITHAEKYTGQVADYRVSDSVMAEVQWVLGEWKMDDVSQRTFNGKYRELLRLHAPTFGHGAQDLAFVPGLRKDHADYGLLYWGFGDGGSNNIRMPGLGHNLRSFLGTILRIDPAGRNSNNGRYGIPDGNPFVNAADPHVVKEIYAYGFRNPHRIAWDASREHRMFVTDIGETNVEEINVVEKGGDYGWPNREGTFGIATLRDLKTVYRLSEADADLFKKPFAQYDHSDGYAISGGYFYDGEIEELRNKYIFGDIVTGRLFYVNIDPQLSDSTIYELPVDQNGKPTDLRTITGIKRLHLRIGYDRLSKRLYVITKADGKIYLVEGIGH